MKCQKRTDTTFGCPVIGRRDLEVRQQVHRTKLQSIKSGIDTRAPAPQPHLTLYGRDYVSKKRATTEAAFSDLKMIQAIAKTMTREHHLPERKGPVTLNTENRKHEIYRIMKENHKLLDHIENVEPWIKSSDLVKDHRMKQRYVINASHTMRLSGDYDPLIAHFRRLDQSQVEETKNRIQARLMRSSGGSVSLPSLTPNGGRFGQGNESPDGRGEASLPSLTPAGGRPQETESPGKGKGQASSARTAPAATKGPASSWSAASSSGSKGGKSAGRGQGKGAEEDGVKDSDADPRSLEESELQAAELVLAASPAAADEPAVEAGTEETTGNAAEVQADTQAATEAVTEAVPAPVPEAAPQAEAPAVAAEEAIVAEPALLEEAPAEESASPADAPAKQEAAADSADVQESMEAENPPAEAAAAAAAGDEYEDEYEEDFANESMSASMKKKETIEPFEDSANFEEDTSS